MPRTLDGRWGLLLGEDTFVVKERLKRDNDHPALPFDISRVPESR